MLWIILLAAAIVVALYGISLYNGLVRLKHNVSKAWANIDVLLKQRHDELPKLVEVCRQYMGFESDALERVTQARNQVQQARSKGDIGALGMAEGALRMGLAGLFAVAEAYPDLKADNGFQHLRTRISTLENEIADRREYYNETVNQNNIQIEQFPDILIARFFGFKPAESLSFDARELTDPDLKALFS